MGHKRRSLEDRFWEKVNKTSGCWHWTGYLDKDGYGQIREAGAGSKNLRAHRAAYQLFRGTIPVGMVTDHKCHTEDRDCVGRAREGKDSCLHRRCVNPNHLELVSSSENVRRGRSGGIKGKLGNALTHDSLTVEIIQEKVCSRMTIAGDHWMWSGAQDAFGHPVTGFNFNRKQSWTTVRFMYTLINNATPSGGDLWNDCGEKLCVNPIHYSCLTKKESSDRRRKRQPSLNQKLQMCTGEYSTCGDKDHVYFDPRGYIYCRPCLNARRKRNNS
jgi:hypothetical protein